MNIEKTDKNSYIWDYSNVYEYIKRVEAEELPPLIITVAITGEGAGKERDSIFWGTPEEQAASTYEAYKAGASSVQVHAADDSEVEISTHTQKYIELNRYIRARCPDIIISNSTSISVWESQEKALSVLYAEPEMCSLNMGPFHTYMTHKKREMPFRGKDLDILRDDILMSNWKDIERIAKIALEKGIKPELKVYNASMFWNVHRLINQKLIIPPYSIELIFSSNNEPPTPKSLIHTIDYVPADSIWSIIGVGPHQMPLATMAILLGGHVRVGFEDNLYYRKSELAGSSAHLVERVVRVARELGRKIATPKQARKMLGLSQVPRQY